eukprot:13410741-Alexandrium_andersonii.AAC.1
MGILSARSCSGVARADLVNASGLSARVLCGAQRHLCNADTNTAAATRASARCATSPSEDRHAL